MMGGEKTKRKWKLKAEITMTDPSPTPNSPVLLDSFRTFVSYPIFFFFSYGGQFRVPRSSQLGSRSENGERQRNAFHNYLLCALHRAVYPMTLPKPIIPYHSGYVTGPKSAFPFT